MLFTRCSQVYSQLSHTSEMWNKINFKAEFSFSYIGCHTNVKEQSLLHYLLIVWKRTVGSTPFQRILALCEMQTVSSTIWTQFTVSIT